jgi:hypothetical protein
MPIVNLKQLHKLKQQGYKVIAPQQGLNLVPDGLASVAKLDLNQNPDAHFFQLAVDGSSQIFIVLTNEAIEFARDWIEENIDRSNYKLLLEYNCYEVCFNDHNNHASILGSPPHARLDFASKFIEELGGKITFDASQNTAPIKIEYETKCKSKAQHDQLAEIMSFESKVKQLLTAVSYVSEFGFALVGRDIIEPTTMWIARDVTRPLKFEEGRTELVFKLMEQDCLDSQAVEIIAKMNSLTSHRTQIVYGYESIIKMLKDDIKKRRAGSLKLSESKKKIFKSELSDWLKSWMLNNEICHDLKYLELLDLNPTEILNNGAAPTNKECVLNTLAAKLDAADPDQEHLELVYQMRIAFSHNRNDEEFSSKQIKSALSAIRKILKNIADL